VDPLAETDSLFGDDINPTRAKSSSFKVQGADDTSVLCEDDYRLMLLRHWSLAESMYHSSYVAARLGIWKEKGRRRLTNLLVKMGYPQKECQQHYKEMSLTFKQTLKEKLSGIAPKYNMSEILFPSFYRHYGYKATLSASDVVYSITALLDAGVEWISKHGSKQEQISLAQADEGLGRAMAGVGVGTKTGYAAVDTQTLESLSSFRKAGKVGSQKGGADDEPEPRDDQDREWIVNFYVAYDALDK
jgi:cell division control protein 45